MIIIDDLLEKYWAGETSLQEEDQLRAYFSGEKIAAEHLLFVEAFAYQNEISKATLPTAFDDLILAEIEGRSTAKVVRPVFGYRKLLAIAAALLFMISASVLLLKKPPPSENFAEIPHLIINGKVYYPATEAEAYKLTKQALLLVSSKMTKEPKASLKSIKKIEKVNPDNWEN